MRALRNDALRPLLAPVLRPFEGMAANGGILKSVGGRMAVLVPAMLLFSAVAIVHGVIRGFAIDVAPFTPVNTAEWDIVVFRGVPSVWMQEVLGTTGFWANFAFFYWSSFFWLPTLLFAFVVLARGRGYFLRLILLQLVLVLSADVIFAIVPTRPPWMDHDLVRIIAVKSANGVHVDRNQFAALPSLHVAIPFAFALWFHGFEKNEWMRRLSLPLFAWALGMGWAVIYTGEHYAIDVVAGYAWAAIVYFTLRRLGVVHASAAFPDAPRAALPLPLMTGTTGDGPLAVPPGEQAA